MVPGWYVLADASELRDRPLGVRLAGKPIVLFRDAGGAPVALADRCAHRGVPLSLGRVERGRLECGYHGWCYDDTGRCVKVPGLLGEIPKAHAVERYPALEQDGFVWVGIEAQGRPFRVPSFPGKGYATIRRTLTFEAGLHATLENILDVPHTAYLHRGLFRGRSEPRRIRVCVTREADGVQAEYLGEPRPEGLAGMLLAPRGGVVTHVDRFKLPSIAQVEYRLGDDAHFLVTACCTPVEEHVTRVHAVVCLKTPLPAFLVKAVALPVASRIVAQDAAMLKAQAIAERENGDSPHVSSTQIDVLGAQIGRLLRVVPADPDVAVEPWVREFEMEA